MQVFLMYKYQFFKTKKRTVQLFEFGSDHYKQSRLSCPAKNISPTTHFKYLSFILVKHLSDFFPHHTKNLHFLSGKGFNPPPSSLTDMSAKNANFFWTAPLCRYVCFTQILYLCYHYDCFRVTFFSALHFFFSLK